MSRVKRARATSPTTTRAREGATVVLDLGGGTLKACVAEDGVTRAFACVNASARTRARDGTHATISGRALDAVTDVNGLQLRRPTIEGTW